jgi:hypothetical protein
MILAALEFCLVISIAFYLGFWRAGVQRRQAQAWERLVEQLQANGFDPDLGDRVFAEDHAVTPQERERRVQDAHGLWSMYENARVMLDMANYAAANSATIDRELLADLRRDAMQIRVCVMIELSRHASAELNESTCGNIARASAVYADMVSRMAELLQANSGALVAGFVPAK